ncbi:hypothetical protein IRJ41_018800 [Triplophysa rosa]|uniref:Uncharacterized protein n=1 Tax=Triplophysa rosa TaxID=992332 RepID=A0A9W8C9V0_TRIRA|nr:hypothetical protein IRJ41_018800 [Triplophysa rosa]
MQRTGGPTGASGTDSGQPTPALTVNQQHEREKDRPGRCSIFVLAGFKSACGAEAVRDFGTLQLQAGRLAGTPSVASSSWRQLLSL